jgi:predicted O-methyltransferase YrrM
VDVTYGNMTLGEAERLAKAAGSVDDVPHEAGSTEPWVSRLVADFIIARGARTVLETGCFKGATSVWIYEALKRLGGGHFFVADIDESRRSNTIGRLPHHNHAPASEDNVAVSPLGDILYFLSMGTSHTFDVAFVDDCHEKSHVTKELMLLMPKMNPGGLILLHDVFGVCDIKTVVQQFGGYSIDLPRLGPAGGLGIIQC